MTGTKEKREQAVYRGELATPDQLVPVDFVPQAVNQLTIVTPLQPTSLPNKVALRRASSKLTVAQGC